MQGHDIIVLGGSIGAGQVLRTIVSGLKRDLPAALFVVVHIGPDSPQMLPDVLSAAGPLQAALARDGEKIENGRIYVAPADFHMILDEGEIRLFKGPRENLSRPSIDPLFRSAAAIYGPRVIGVLVSGFLNDGASGMEAVKRCGGVAVIQDPGDAAYPDLPRNAAHAVKPDYIVPSVQIAPLLTRLAETQPGRSVPVPRDIEAEVRIARSVSEKIDLEEEITVPSPFSCPECGGPIREISRGITKRYRCYMGHGYTELSLAVDQKRQIEQAFLVALRLLEERIVLLKKLAHDYGHLYIQKHYGEEIGLLEKHRDSIRRFLTSV